MNTMRARYAILIAVLLWAASTLAELTVGTPIPRATLALAGAVLLSLVSMLPPLTGAWARRVNVALGVAAAVVAGLYAYDPQAAADIMRLVPAEPAPADSVSPADSPPAVPLPGAPDAWSPPADGAPGADVSDGLSAE